MGGRACCSRLRLTVQKDIPIYDVPSLDLTAQGDALMAEWASVLADGAGVLVLKAWRPAP